MTVALYPGTFDPVTYGHLDIAKRASVIFDRLVIGVFEDSDKGALFSPQTRIDLFQGAVAGMSHVEVAGFRGLTVEFARQVGATVLVRGLRMNTDFEYEFEMALMNRKLAPDIEVISLMTSLEYQYVSSTLLKEVVRLGGDISDLVSTPVLEALQERFSPGASPEPS